MATAPVSAHSDRQPVLGGRLVPLVLVAGALMVILGSMLPWVTGADAAALVVGRTEFDGVAALGSRAGLAGGDGVLTLIAGVVAGLCGMLALTGHRSPTQRGVLAGAGAVAAAWAILDLVEIGQVAGPDGEVLRISPGAGVVLVAVGAVLVLVCAASLRGDSERDLRRQARIVDRLARRGELARVLERQQRLVRLCIRRLGWRDTRTIDEAMFLARLHAAGGYDDSAAMVADLCLRKSLEHHPGNTALQADVRREVAAINNTWP